MKKPRFCHACGRTERPGLDLNLKVWARREYPRPHDLLACDDCRRCLRRAENHAAKSS